MFAQPNARASSSARISALYSATLLVVMPSGSATSLTTFPSGSARLIPIPAGPGLPRAAPSTCTTNVAVSTLIPPPFLLCWFVYTEQSPAVLAGLDGFRPLDGGDQ